MISPGVCQLGPVELHYLEAGVGDLVVCLHGFPDHAPTFRPLLEGLAADGFRAVAPFMRGFAPSTGAAGSLESAALAGDVMGLANALGAGEDVALVGHDRGALAALHAGVLHPDRITALVTLGTPHGGALREAIEQNPTQLRRSWYEFFFLAEGLAERVVSASNFAFLDRLLAEWSPASPFLPEQWVAVKRTLSGHGVLEAALGYFRAALGAAPGDPALAASAERALDRVAVPTLALFGDADGRVGAEVHESQAHHFSGPFRAERLKGVGNWPHLEEPEATLSAIGGFLRR
ncbi:MAG: alpha/beta fold hydrolase [Miltoncostaeaceae bacterium]